jgi:hypothetical protein
MVNSLENQSRTKVLYLIGSGRSGSTLLGTVLNNYPNIASGGELHYLVEHGWLKNLYCSCGKKGKDCNFWNQVFREWKANLDTVNLEQYCELQELFEVPRDVSCWLRLLWERKNPSPAFRTYTELTQQLFKAIQKVSGKSIILDPSKNPARGFALSLMPELELNFIHWIRDARGVAFSLQKEFEKNEGSGIDRDYMAQSVWRSALFWNIINLQAEWVITQKDKNKSIRVLYEEFLANPTLILDKIGALVGTDLSQLAADVNAGKIMPVEHNIAGNRLRMQKEVKLQPDLEWIDNFPVKEQRLLWFLTGWLASKYGYQLVCR